MKVKCITINTDASFHPVHKVGGYAFWVTSDDFRLKLSGPLKKVKNSSHAEVMSIGNAIAALLRYDIQSDFLIINTDCIFAITTISTAKKNPGRFVRSQLEELVVKFKINKYEFRHVKAHSGINDKRSYVNEWCDVNAKFHMRKLIK